MAKHDEHGVFGKGRAGMVHRLEDVEGAQPSSRFGGSISLLIDVDMPSESVAEFCKCGQ